MKIARTIAMMMALLMSGTLPAQTLVRISKTQMMLALLQDGDTVLSMPISCGRVYGPKLKKNDMRTPEGRFKIEKIEKSHLWGHDFGDGLGFIKDAYGPWFIRLDAGDGIGIHGTHAPETMGLRASEGCIRLRNEDLLQLKPYLRRGMTVEILPDSFPSISCTRVEIATLNKLLLHNQCINNNFCKNFTFPVAK